MIPQIHFAALSMAAMIVIINDYKAFGLHFDFINMWRNSVFNTLRHPYFIAMINGVGS